MTRGPGFDHQDPWPLTAAPLFIETDRERVIYAVWMRDLRYPAPGYTGNSITSYVPLGYYKLA